MSLRQNLLYNLWGLLQDKMWAFLFKKQRKKQTQKATCYMIPFIWSKQNRQNLDIRKEKAMAPHSSTLAWKIPWTEEPGRLQSMGSLESDTTEWLHFHFSLSCIGEGNGNPLQCSCLENSRDGEAWWAAVYGVTQSQIRLKWLSSSRQERLVAARGKGEKMMEHKCLSPEMMSINVWINFWSPCILCRHLTKLLVI